MKSYVFKKNFFKESERNAKKIILVVVGRRICVGHFFLYSFIHFPNFLQ